MRLIRSAFVIGRRDFAATVFSRSFLLFLLAPLFPVLMGAIFGGIGATAASEAEQPVVAVVGSAEDFRALQAERRRIDRALETLALVELRHFPPEPDIAAQRARLLKSERPPVIGVLEGGLDRPRITAAVKDNAGVVRQLNLLIDGARQSRADRPEGGNRLELVKIERSSGAVVPARALTARAAQVVLFLLTILLSGMLLSQLIEEKSNKVIEVLAAAVPIDAIFLGKLFAMLAMSLIGIAVWTAAGASAIAAYAEQGLSALPAPAVGWPAFLALAAAYFATSYLLLGSAFLGIGAHASTAREVQTLSMPVTMAQVVIFGIAATAVGNLDSTRGLAAAAFPLSSPFVMIARAAEQPALWPHLVGLAWQLLWVALILHLGARMFRRSVLKSGPSRSFWRRSARA